MIDLEDIRKRHHGVIDGPRRADKFCDGCAQDWPCDAVRLADEVERLRLWEINIFPDHTVHDRMVQGPTETHEVDIESTSWSEDVKAWVRGTKKSPLR